MRLNALDGFENQDSGARIFIPQSPEDPAHTGTGKFADCPQAEGPEDNQDKPERSRLIYGSPDVEIEYSYGHHLPPGNHQKESGRCLLKGEDK